MSSKSSKTTTKHASPLNVPVLSIVEGAKSRRAGKLFLCKTNPILTFKNEA